MLTDIEIAQQCNVVPVEQIAKKAGILPEELEPYGRYKAKISLAALARLKDEPDGRLILVTATSPTPAGEGKTTVTVGLGQALNRLGKKCTIAIREPSLGPVMGIKGGAAGGGYSQVVPMEEINLHFTGDIHAVTAAHNLLAALVDNHIHQGNALGIDPRSVTWKRVMDMNDRSLRDIIVGLGGKNGGVPRESGFMITAASEVMAILCLASGLPDLKERLSRIVVGRTWDNRPVTAGDLQAEGAMSALLKEAVKPNLVQTLEGTPCLIHGGPFANIAHGCNSVLATRLALKLGEYVVTEAGFGSDLGAEKFLDIKCRHAGLSPAAIVVVTTVRALKYHGGIETGRLSEPDPEAVRRGLPNLRAHIENMKGYHLPVVVAVNRFSDDTGEELNVVQAACQELSVPCSVCDVFTRGGEGGLELAREVVKLTAEGSGYQPAYSLKAGIKEKIEQVIKKIYHAGSVEFLPQAERAIRQITADGYGTLPVCIAKTQYSFSDDAALKGAPQGFSFTVRDVTLSAGAGFVVALSGSIMTMPGLGKAPAACRIDIDGDGNISGLF